MPTIYFFSTDNDGTNHCTGSAAGGDNDALLEEAGATTGNITDEIPGQTTDRISFLATTETGSPNLADWGTGDYSLHFRVVSVNSTIDIAANFLRRLAACGADSDLGTTAEVDPPIVGVNTLTLSGASSSGLSTDRLQVRLLGDNTHHNPQDIVINYDGVDTRVVAPFGGMLIPVVYHLRTRGNG